jgi:hypothetical protein
MKRPLAYITSAWSDNEFETIENAADYCRAVYDAGFSPICPVLFMPLFLNDEIPEVPIAGLLDGYEINLTGMGYVYSTKLQFLKRAAVLIKRHEDQGLERIDPAIISEYTREIDERYYDGILTKHYHRGLTREIQRFVNYVDSGKSDALPSPLRGSRQELTPKFERLAEEFVSGEFHPNTFGDIRWVTRKYFSWLEKQGYTDMLGVGAVQIQQFLLHCSELYAPSSIHNIKLYLKKLYAHLYATGKTDSAYSALLSFTVSREKKVFPTLPKADIAKLLDAIDRTSQAGKRNYAVMMLGVGALNSATTQQFSRGKLSTIGLMMIQLPRMRFLTGQRPYANLEDTLAPSARMYMFCLINTRQ